MADDECLRVRCWPWSDTTMAGTQSLTILFCDLVASTERRARLGDDVFDEFTHRFMSLLRDTIDAHQGRVVSSAGDGLMVVFRHSVADAVACATAMHEAVATLDANDPPRLRVGISSGEVAEDGDNFSGMPIVEAARLESAAAPGQTLANAVVRTLVGTRRGLRFSDVGALALKGIPEPLPAVEVIDDDAIAIASSAPKPKIARRARIWRRPLIAGAVVAALALVGVGLVATRSGTRDQSAAVGPGVPTPQGYVPTYSSTKCPDDVVTAAPDATCGHLVVPQNRTEPKKKQVTLLVTRAPARVPDAGAAPSIDVCGCEDIGNSLTRDHAALLHIATRGYQGSDPELSCPEFAATRIPAIGQPSNDPTMVTQGTDGFRRCYARLVRDGIEPAQYNPATAAQDVLDLMYALKIRRADFTAFETTDLEVFAIMRQAPAAVRSITLDNPPPPGATPLTEPVTDLAGAFNRYVALCGASKICAHSYPDLAGSWRSSYTTLETTPSVVSVDNSPGAGVPSVSVLLDGHRAADALATALDTPDTYPLIPAAITQTIADGVTANQALNGGDSFDPSAPWGAQASYYCGYRIHTQNADAAVITAHNLPQFVRGHDTHWAEWCTAWKVPDVAAVLSANVVSTVPAFLFRGALASTGNSGWIPAIERGLAHAQSAVFPTLGQDLLATGPSCLSDLRRAFLKDPLRKLPIVGCERQSPTITFVAPQ